MAGLAGAWRGLLAFAAGAIAAGLTPALPAWPVVGLLLGTGLAALLHPRLRIAGALLLGLAWFCAHAQFNLDRSWPDARAGEVIQVSGSVASVPETRGFQTRFVLVADRPSRARGVPKRVLVSWYRPREYFQPGEIWHLTVRLDPPSGQVNPGAFDYRRFLLARRIGATATVLEAARAAPSGRLAAVARTRQRVGEWLQATTVNLDAAALHRALSVADRSALDPDLGGLLRRTGTAHLLAISGLHVGMVAGLAGLAAAWAVTPFLPLWPGLERRRVGLVVGLVAAVAYAALAGFTLPTRRALVMLAVGAGAVVFRRGLRPGHALVLALCAVLLVDPLAPLATGFWLSFAAVAVLIWAFAWRPGQSGWARGLVRAQILIAIGLLPLNAGLFQQLVPVALVANLAAIPVVGFWVLPLLLVSLVLFLAGLPAAWAVGLAETGLVPLLSLLEWLDRLQFGHFPVVGGSWPAIGLALLGAGWLLAPRGWPARGLGVVLFLPLMVPPQPSPPAGQFEAWLADVGDGLAVVVRTASETLLYDTGPGDGRDRHRVDSIITPLLRRVGAERLDRLVVSHDRRAHAGGVAGILERYDPGTVLASAPGPVQPCVAGQGWHSDGVSFAFLHPSAGLPYLGPDSSCVLEIRGASASLLLPGGAGAVVGRRLLKTGKTRPVDAVVLPRAGHRDALERTWWNALQAEWALASVGRHNRRGLPHDETVRTTAASGARLVSTGDCGAIRVRSGGPGGIEVRSQARLQPRFWRPRAGCP